MATALEQLVADLKLNTAKWTAGIDKANAGIDSMQRKMGGASKGIQKGSDASASSVGNLTGALKTAAIAAAALGTAATVAFLFKISAAAAEGETVLIKFSKVFGAHAQATNEWVTNVGKATGISQTELQALLSTVQDMFVPMGFARDAAAGMSKEMAKLVLDVAAFNRQDPTAVMRAFQGALVGQGRAVLRYGILLNEATLEQELFRMGIIGGTKAATDQQKVQARMNILLAGSKDAFGAAAKDADTFAGATRRVNAQWEDMKDKLGAKFNKAILDYTTAAGGAEAITLRVEKAITKLRIAFALVKTSAVILFGVLGASVQANWAIWTSWFNVVSGVLTFLGGKGLRAVASMIDAMSWLMELMAKVTPDAFGGKGIAGLAASARAFADSARAGATAMEDFGKGRLNAVLDNFKQVGETVKWTMDQATSGYGEIVDLTNELAVTEANRNANSLEQVEAAKRAAEFGREQQDATEKSSDAAKTLGTGIAAAADASGALTSGLMRAGDTMERTYDAAVRTREILLQNHNLNRATAEAITKAAAGFDKVILGRKSVFDLLSRDAGFDVRSETVDRGFAHGGLVRGRGTQDSMAARLTPGEMVLPRELVDALSMGSANVSTTINLQGSGSARQQVQSLIPELERSIRRGMLRSRRVK